MTDSVIELDLSVPWEPPEPPAPRRRLQARWVAAAAVLAVTLGVLVAGGPLPDGGRLYTVQVQVLEAQLAGGRLIIARYQPTAPGPMIEARRASDGALLWEHSTDLQQTAVAGPDVVLLLTESSTGDGVSNGLVVLDAATGKELWSRPRIGFQGTNAAVVVVEEVRSTTPTIITGLPDQDPGVNYARTTPERRFLGLAARTGTVVWDVTIPEGRDVDLGWASPYQSRLVSFDELSPTGQLTRRDARTGAVTETRQLDWSGRSAMLGSGWLDGSGRVRDRLVVYPAGERGADVYDLATGGKLFRWAGDGGGTSLFRCTERIFCANDGTGLTAVDITTGKPRWHLDGPGMVAGFAGERLLVGTFAQMNAIQPTLTGIVDSRTGTVVRKLADWRVLGTGGSRPLVWRPVDERTAILGELDPATGTVAVFATAGNWFGDPACSVDGRFLACLVGGELSVWRLPNRR
ncbi:PQQ-binding-like beta-propeller repeat protein [Dactylosporangium siamense]|uniref:outer membrane protein assembly factor BamB family protein n=1 Tax=Dactylosporangium siamense TaxID=685454 RepID=UPI0019444C92|nr:PQQ-binding-like beta-propeller repeat protein [Dactylosporangium siamense]